MVFSDMTIFTEFNHENSVIPIPIGFFLVELSKSVWLLCKHMCWPTIAKSFNQFVPAM